MKNKRTGSREKGFTLVEVLVALAVFSLVFLTLFSSFDAFVHSSRLIRDRQAGDSGVALDIMTSDLLQVFVPQVPQFSRPDLRRDASRSEDRFRFFTREDRAGGRDFPVLSFTSLSPVVFGRSAGGTVRLTYYVHEDDSGRLDLHRSDRSVFSLEGQTGPLPCSDPVLVRDIRTFELVFTDEDGEEYSQWDSEDKALEYALPSGVFIRIERNLKASKDTLCAGIHIPVERRVLQ